MCWGVGAQPYCFLSALLKLYIRTSLCTDNLEYRFVKWVKERFPAPYNAPRPLSVPPCPLQRLSVSAPFSASPPLFGASPPFIVPNPPLLAFALPLQRLPVP